MLLPSADSNFNIFFKKMKLKYHPECKTACLDPGPDLTRRFVQADWLFVHNNVFKGSVRPLLWQPYSRTSLIEYNPCFISVM